MTSRILVTGAGGPAAITFLKATKDLPIEVHMADMDPLAAGLYLVPKSQRALLPAGAAPDFVDCMLATCRARNIEVLVPTVDTELLALATHRDRFEHYGIQLLLASYDTLELCLDKWALLQRCWGHVLIPKSAIFDHAFTPVGWNFPLIVKPRRGSGSRDIHLVQNQPELERLLRGEDWLVQEFLCGKEYSVDVIANAKGEVLAAVPRERTKIDSGVAVASHTVNDPILINAA
ncbi:MAG: ATP-grasp domain-containing protein [Kofleriaceae bacterium]|nr:ATP-grasp domain-containing protein [Kofleriaceae bacterium]